MEKMRQGGWLHTFSFFYKSLMWGESKLSAAYFQFILIALNLPYNTNKLYEILDYRSRDMLNFNFGDMLNFNFSEKGLGQVSSPDFEHDFSKKKMFLMLHSINWANFFVWFSLLLKILDIMCIAIVC